MSIEMREDTRCALRAAFGAQRLQLASTLSFAGLVVIARSPNPIPSRTRPLNSSAPMVLSLKAWKSRSLPGLPRTKLLITMTRFAKPAAGNRGGVLFSLDPDQCRWPPPARALMRANTCAPRLPGTPNDQLDHRPHLRFHLPHADGVDVHLR